jgi:hypothetical protein
MSWIVAQTIVRQMVSVVKTSFSLFHHSSLHNFRDGILVPTSETSFYQADDEDVEVSFENQNEQGLYTRLRVIQPFFWFTAERAERKYCFCKKNESKINLQIVEK